MSDRLRLATATGLPFLALAFHFATGLIAIAAGFVALSVRKGGKWHRRGGVVFTCAMIATGVTAAAIAAYEGKPTIIGGALAAYLVFTGYTAARPLPGVGRHVQIALTVLALAIAVMGYRFAVAAWERPGHQVDGVPAGMTFFMSTIVLVAAIGDIRLLRAGGIQGTRRVARHLWRMSFGLFIASGSFFLGQMTFIPERVRIVPLLVVLAVGPLVLLLYWMWRVRLRQNLRGLLTATPVDGGHSRVTARPT